MEDERPSRLAETLRKQQTDCQYRGDCDEESPIPVEQYPGKWQQHCHEVKNDEGPETEIRLEGRVEVLLEASPDLIELRVHPDTHYLLPIETEATPASHPPKLRQSRVFKNLIAHCPMTADLEITLSLDQHAGPMRQRQ